MEGHERPRSISNDSLVAESGKDGELSDDVIAMVDRGAVSSKDWKLSHDVIATVDGGDAAAANATLQKERLHRTLALTHTTENLRCIKSVA